MVRNAKKQVTWLIGVLASYALVCTPPSVSARGLFGMGGGGGGTGSDLADILAAGLVTKLLMEDFGGSSGGGGQSGGEGRVPAGPTLWDHISERIAWAASRYHQRFALPPPLPNEAGSFMKYSFFPAPLMGGHPEFHPAEMRLRPRFLFPPARNPLLFSETNAIPMMNYPFGGLFSEPLTSDPELEFLNLPDSLQHSSSSRIPIFIDDSELSGLRANPGDIFQARADEERPRYILPRIVRHFVQRILHRGEQLG